MRTPTDPLPRRGLVRGLPLILLLALAAGEPAPSRLLFDFEQDTQGWEQEAVHSAPLTCGEEAHHGARALAALGAFQPGNESLQLRVKTAGQKDFSADPDFSGFSAWVYTPRSGIWSIRMFVRSGPQWTWTTGPSVEQRHRGWVRVEILKNQIFDPHQVQDLGLQVTLQKQKLIATVAVDQVEALAAE